ncbi:MAG: HAD family hydrolase [Campylobacterota bacterium]|nr:HAD family hydrolase [Campylobacterota bacterium]
MNKALFLDRDGVINVEVNYLHKKDDFVFIDGIFDLCKHYQCLGYLIIVVTNQSGIAREYYSEEDFQSLTQWMVDKFREQGILISHVYHCPHHPKITGVCKCRKPESQMLLDAKDEFDLDMLNSLIIGDKERDILSGLNAGLRETYLLDESCLMTESKATKIVSKLDDIWKNEC